MWKVKIFDFIRVIVLTTLFPFISQAAIFNTSCIDELTGESNGCTAQDIAVQNIKIIYIDDGCTGVGDTARVKMETTVNTANPARYDPGIFINTKGGNSAVVDSDNTTLQNQCLHEALYPIDDNATGLVNYVDGFGPFKDLESGADSTGDMLGNESVTRKITQGDIGDLNQSDEAIITILCADNDDGTFDPKNPTYTPNGYVDFAWAISYAQNPGTLTPTSIIETVPGAKSKCTSGISDTYNTPGSLTIGVPDLSVDLVCAPLNVDVGEPVSCTATYTNASLLGAADFMKFKINYPGSQGVISNIVNNGAGETGVDDTANDIIDWGMSGGLTEGNIPLNTTNTMTFDFTYNGGPDFDISIDTFYDNTFYPESDQGLSKTVSFTTVPVTIAYVNPQEGGNGLEVDFSTASETSNIGFNVYAVKGKRWTKLNDEIIPGALDSFEPRDYHVNLAVPSYIKVKKIGIAGVDASGVEDRHGPFKVGRESGAKVTAVKVDWKKVQKQVKADRKAKKAAKRSLRNVTKRALKDQVIRLNVKEDAVYRVTHDELMEAGINLSGQKAKSIAISLKGKGVARHIAGVNKKGKWTADSWIEFLGTSPKGTDMLYVDTNRYQLSLNKRLVVQTSGIEPLMVKTKVFEANNRYSYSLPQEDPFYDGYFYARGEGQPGYLTRNFEMPKLEEGMSTLKVNLSAYSSESHELVISLNDVQIASKSAEGRMDWPIEVPVDNNLFVEGKNKITLTIPGREEIFDYLVYDKLTVTYSGGKLNESLRASIEVTDKIRKKEIKLDSGINYVIISHPLFIGKTLDRYVKQRVGEGWNIKVVNVEDIYAAYGYGMATPDAIKNYLKMAKRKGVTHVQLVGAATYDYHDYLKTGAISFIPSMYAATSKIIQYTPCDACLVLNKNEVPALAIGRWPVRTLEGLEAVVNKTLAWENTGQSAAHTGLFIADATDKGMNFGTQMEETAQKFVEKGWTELTRVYLDDMIVEKNGVVNDAVIAAHSDITTSLASGVSITSYSGHSSPSVWSFKGLLKHNDIASIDNVGKTTMALPLACFATYGDSPYINTMAHQLLTAGENGAVAVYGASTTSYYGDNGVAAKKVIDGLLEGKTIGIAVKEMKKSLGARYRDVIRNGVLQGDVTLRLK